jgi:hypothetical protein
MVKKTIYICVAVVLSVGFYVLGLYTHRQAVINNNTYTTTNSSPNFVTEKQPYMDFAYDQCIKTGNVPDDSSCFYKLNNSTIAEANTLAEKIISGTPKGKIKDEIVAEYFKDRNSYILGVQDNIGNYLDNFCGLDSMRIYGVADLDYMSEEESACRYYHADQYLDLLKYLDQSRTQWGG